eukprot:326551_1
MSTTSRRANFLLLLSSVSSSNAFQATNRRIHHPVSSRCRQRRTAPPLYYTDVEPEIDAITVGFNATSSLLSPPLQSSVGEEDEVLRKHIKEDEDDEEGSTKKRRRGRPRTKPKKKKLSLRIKPLIRLSGSLDITNYNNIYKKMDMPMFHKSILC